jgi:hypothetical protein
MRYLSITAGLAVLALLVSCAPQVALPPAAAEEKAAAGKGADNGGGWSTVKGQVVYEGPDDNLQPKEVNVNKDQEHCLSKGKLYEQKWVINPKNKGVRWAYVWLTPDPQIRKPDHKKFTPEQIHPSLRTVKDKEVVMDQPCCQFEPHALAMRAGQVLVIKNSAPVSHNSKYDGDPANQPSGNPTIAPGKEVKVEGIGPSWKPMMIECGMHGWMKSWVRSFDHPYFAVTDADGKFEIPNAPAGDFWLVIWHEEGGWRDIDTSAGERANTKYGMKITIKADGTTDLGPLALKPAKN